MCALSVVIVTMLSPVQLWSQGGIVPVEKALKPYVSAKLEVQRNDEVRTTLKLTITNISEFKVSIQEMALLPTCKLVILDHLGNQCPPTTEGGYIFNGRLQAGFSSSFARLKSGDSKVWTLDLTKYFNLKAGQYSLDFSIDVLAIAVDKEDKRYPMQATYTSIVEIKDFKFIVIP
jgi:hypothetical protein